MPVNQPENLEGVVRELLTILDQTIPEFGSIRSAEAAFSRGRNAEKMASANYLRYHLQRLGITELPTI